MTSKKKSKKKTGKKAKGKSKKASASKKVEARVLLTDLPFDPSAKKVPRGLKLFGRQLDRVRQILKTEVAHGATGPDAMLGHVLYRADVRTPLFMLEGLARVARRSGGDRAVFDDVLREVKIAEDLIGDVDFWWTMSEKGTAWKLPLAWRAWAEQNHRVAAGRAVGWLEARAWLDHRYLPEEGEVRLRTRRLGETLAAQPWPNPKKERKALVQFLHDRVLAVHEAAKGLDLTELEDGVHELRRKIRWLSIYAAALDGAIQLDPKAEPPPGWSRYLTPAVVDNPFNVLPKGDGSIEPILLPAPLFYALSWMIAEIGDLKDRAQWTETVAHGLAVTDSGGRSKPQRWLGDDALEPEQACREVAAMAEQTLVKDKLLERLAKAIAKQK